jgi:hypothetical protein
MSARVELTHGQPASAGESTLAQPTSHYARSVNYTLEPEEAGVLLKLQADQWEANVHASADDLLRLSDIRSTSWDERRSIQAGRSAGARVYWSAGEGDDANLMIGEDDETWDVSVTVPYTVIDEVVQALRSL